MKMLRINYPKEISGKCTFCWSLSRIVGCLFVNWSWFHSCKLHSIARFNHNFACLWVSKNKIQGGMYYPSTFKRLLCHVCHQGSQGLHDNLMAPLSNADVLFSKGQWPGPVLGWCEECVVVRTRVQYWAPPPWDGPYQYKLDWAAAGQAGRREIRLMTVFADSHYRLHPGHAMLGPHNTTAQFWCISNPRPQRRAWGYQGGVNWLVLPSQWGLHFRGFRFKSWGMEELYLRFPVY